MEMEAAARIAASSLASLILRTGSIMFAVVLSRALTAFFNCSKSANDVDSSTDAVRMDLNLLRSLARASAIEPVHSTILQLGHSWCACSVYRLSVKR